MFTIPGLRTRWYPTSTAPGRVLRDAVLDDAVPVAQVDALAQVHEELFVRLARDEVRRRQLRLRGRAGPRRVCPLDCVLVLFWMR